MKGAVFVGPHSLVGVDPNHLYYHQELFATERCVTLPLSLAIGKCAVLSVDDYVSCKWTESLFVIVLLMWEPFSKIHVFLSIYSRNWAFALLARDRGGGGPCFTRSSYRWSISQLLQKCQTEILLFFQCAQLKFRKRISTWVNQSCD